MAYTNTRDVEAALRAIGFAEAAPDCEAGPAFSHVSRTCTTAIDAALDDEEFWAALSHSHVDRHHYRDQERVVDLAVDAFGQQMIAAGYQPPPPAHHILDMVREVVSDGLFVAINRPVVGSADLVGAARTALIHFRRAIDHLVFYPPVANEPDRRTAPSAVRRLFGRLKLLLLGVATAGALAGGMVMGADLHDYAVAAAAEITGGMAVYAATRPERPEG